MQEQETEEGLAQLAVNREERGEDTVQRLTAMEKEIRSGQHHTRTLTDGAGDGESVCVCVCVL